MAGTFRYIVVPALAIILYFFGGELFQEPSPSPVNEKIPQTNLKTVGLLLNKDGIPEEFGYMTMPLKVLNENNLNSWQKFRMKRWDYFDVFTDQAVITVTLADLTVAGEVRSCYFDFATRTYKKFAKTLLPTNIPKMSSSSYRFTGESKEDDILYQDDDITLRVENHGRSGSEQYFLRSATLVSKSLGLNLNLNMSMTTNQEAISVVTPLSEDKQHFFYTVKMPNIMAEGTLKVGNIEHQITQENAGSFIDWGRGIWTYNTYWVFTRAHGFLENGKRFGLVMVSGYGDTNKNQATEDAFFIDHHMFKLNAIKPNFDDNNLMNPWTFKTIPNGKKDFKECEVIFAPHLQDKKGVNFVVIRSEMRLVFGQYTGWVTDDTGKKYEFENVNGYIEIHRAKW